MLKVLVQSLMISRVQAEYRERGTLSGVRTAERIRAVRITFEQMAGRFNERQAKASSDRKPFLADGRRQTLEDQLFGPLATSGWPTRAAAVLHGLKPDTSHPMPDPNSYLAKIQVGPDQERSFRDYCGIAIYFDPLNAIHIAWVGPEVDFGLGCRMLASETARFTDWSKLL